MLKSLLYLAIMTTAVVASWIGFAIYHNSVTSTISSDTSIRITPIDAQFDKETIETIRQKRVIRADLSETRVEVSIIPSSTASATTSSTGSAQTEL
jgi:hypothetical protein